MIIYNKAEFIVSNIKKKVWLIDDNLYKLNKIRIDNLKKNDFYCIIFSGEKSKSFDNYKDIINKFLKQGIKRDCYLIAIGGGVIGDVSGFIASTYLRGIKLIQIPTTLLSMVDSSIGGKNGINTNYGKNLIGTIYQPEKIIIDRTFLYTLPKKEMINGMAEIIKIALLQGKELLQLLINNNWDSWHNIENKVIQLASSLKLEIIKGDEKDTNRKREILNFGHTWGHALEWSNNLDHGYSISIGMMEEIKFTNYYYGYPSQDTIKYIKKLLVSWNLPISYSSISLKLIKGYMENDKKSNRLVSLKSILNPVIVEHSWDQWLELKAPYIRLSPLNITSNDTKEPKTIFIPSSKSITNRVLIISSIIPNEIIINNPLDSLDTQIMIDALRNSNIKIIKENNIIIVKNQQNFNPHGTYYLGNSGTSVRFLIPLFALKTKEPLVLDGSREMRNRPIGPLVKALTKLGCNISYLKTSGYLPVKIMPASYFNDTIEIDGTLSSQYVSGILMAICSLPKIPLVKISGERTSFTFIKMTLKLLLRWGIRNFFKTTPDNYEILLVNNCKPLDLYDVEGDASTASYFIALSYMTQTPIKIPNINCYSLQGDIKIIKLVCKHLGDIKIKNSLLFIPFNKPIPDNMVFNLDSSDTFLTWACLWITFDKNLEITNIANQNWKECKRIDEWISNYKHIGGKVEKTNTGMKLHNNTINNNRIVLYSCNDHRMAMAWSLVLYKYNNLIIYNPTCVNKTCPLYWKLIDHYFNANCSYELLGECREIILIGMPNSGKTLLGKELKNNWHIKVHDTDDILENKFTNLYNINNIERYIKLYGWAKFRKQEYDAFKDLIKYQKFKIISLGGGSIESIDLRNKLDDKIVIWIRRPLDVLSSEKNKKILEYNIKTLYSNRKLIYQYLSDYEYDNIREASAFPIWLNQIISFPTFPLKSTFLCINNVLNEELIADAIEVRADLSINNGLDLIQNLIINYQRPIIYTIRSKLENGRANSISLKLIETAIKLGVKLVDIEFTSNKKILKPHLLIINSIHSNDINLIKSYLNNNNNIIKIVSSTNTLDQLSNEINNLCSKKIIIDNDTLKYRLSNQFLTPLKSINLIATGKLQLNLYQYLEKCYLNTKYDFYFIFGSVLGNSPSSYLHNYVFSKLNKKAIYIPFQTTNIEKIKHIIKQDYFKGASITMPFKQDIIDLIKLKSKTRITNTIKINTNSKKIDTCNTDLIAIQYYLNSFGLRKAHILGTGSTALTTIYACLKNNMKVYLYGRNLDKVKKLVKEFKLRSGDLLSNFNNKISIKATNSMEKESCIINCLPPHVNITDNIDIDISYGIHSLFQKKITGFDIIYLQAAYQYSFWFNYSIKQTPSHIKLYHHAITEYINQKYYLLDV